MTLAKPDQTFFLGIGAEQAGLTWMHNRLSTHPSLWMPLHREIHYFDAVHLPDGDFYRESKYATLQHLLERNEWATLATRPERLEQIRWFAKQALVGIPDDEWYKGLFEEASRRVRVFGEITPAYAALPRRGFYHIQAIEPMTRIILVLRDPVTRLWSTIRHFHANRPQHGVMASVEAMVAFARRPANVAKTRYDITIDHLHAVFPAEQVLIAYYEDFVDKPSTRADFLRALTDFLGVSPDGISTDDEDSEPSATITDLPPYELRQILAAEYEGTVNRVEEQLGRVPVSWRDHPVAEGGGIPSAHGNPL